MTFLDKSARSADINEKDSCETVVYNLFELESII